MRGNRTMKYKRLYLLIIICLASCNKLAPGGFWNNFDSAHINGKTTDQGPWAVQRVIYWESQVKYKDSDVLSFASNNGWTVFLSKIENDFGDDSSWMKYPGKLYILKKESVNAVDKGERSYCYLLISADHTKMSVNLDEMD